MEKIKYLWIRLFYWAVVIMMLYLLFSSVFKQVAHLQENQIISFSCSGKWNSCDCYSYSNNNNTLELCSKFLKDYREGEQWK